MTGVAFNHETIHNHHERPAFEALRSAAPRFGHLSDGLLADVACMDLNRLPPRCIRHEVDLPST